MSAQELFIIFAIPIVLGVIFAFSFTVEPRRLINGVLFNFFCGHVSCGVSDCHFKVRQFVANIGHRRIVPDHYFDRCLALCVAFILVVVECHSGLAA